MNLMWNSIDALNTVSSYIQVVATVAVVMSLVFHFRILDLKKEEAFQDRKKIIELENKRGRTLLELKDKDGEKYFLQILKNPNNDTPDE